MGEILGAVFLAGDQSNLNPTLQIKPVKVSANGIESKDGQTLIDKKKGKLVKILENMNPIAYYDVYANQLGLEKQSAVLGSFNEQKRMWRKPPKTSLKYDIKQR